MKRLFLLSIMVTTTLLLLRLNSANALVIYNGTIIKPNSTSTGHYVIYTDVIMDELIVNSSHVSFMGMPPPNRTVNIFYANWTLFEQHFTDGNLTLPYIDDIKYITFDNSQPGGSAYASVFSVAPVVTTSGGQPETVTTIPEGYMWALGVLVLILITLIVIYYYRRRKRNAARSDEVEVQDEEPQP